MFPLLADEDFNNIVLRQVLRLNPALDIVRVQDVGLRTATDPVVLEWAAEHGRAVMTHDRSTMIAHAHRRVEQGLAMPGLVIVPRPFPLRQVIKDLHLLAECGISGELEGKEIYLPFR